MSGNARADAIHRTILVYCIVCWIVMLWLLAARWPLVGPDLRSGNVVAVVLLVINGLVRAFYVPRERLATAFWSGLFHVRPHIFRPIERFIYFASNGLLAALGVFMLVVIFYRESLTRDRIHVAATVTLIVMVLYPPIEFAALAALGREVLYPPPRRR